MIKYILYIVTLLLFLTFPTPVQALIFTEIGYNPVGTDTGHEWVEVYNDQEVPVDLSALLFYVDDQAEASPIQISGEVGGQGDLTLQPKQISIIAANAKLFLADHPGYLGTVADSTMSLLNSLPSGERSITLGLLTTQQTVVTNTEYVPLSPSVDGYSFELRDGWTKSSQIGGSPGTFVSLATPSDSPAPSSAEVRLSEIVSNPVGNDTGAEQVEIENYGDSTINLAGWKITDSQAHNYILGENIIGAHGYLVVMLSTSILNNSDESVSLVRPDGSIADTVVMKEAAKEGWSYARVNDSWVWTDQLTLGLPNQASRSPLISVSPKANAASSKPTSPKASTSAKASVTKSPSPKSSKASSSPKPTKLSTSISPKAITSTDSKTEPNKRYQTIQPVVKGVATQTKSKYVLLTVVILLTVLLVGSVIVYRFKLLALFKKYKERWHKDLIT